MYLDKVGDTAWQLESRGASFGYIYLVQDATALCGILGRQSGDWSCSSQPSVSKLYAQKEGVNKVTYSNQVELVFSFDDLWLIDAHFG